MPRTLGYAVLELAVVVIQIEVGPSVTFAPMDEFLAADKKRLDNIDESTRVTQRALLALLAHGIDGNHHTQMEEAKQELEEHLIKK